nr:hypothetical protein [Paenibacillus bovis]
MRKEAFSQKYYNPDPSKPTSMRLTIIFNDSKEFSTIIITNQVKRVLINNSEYKLYGDGIDVAEIWNLTQQWKDS